MHQKKSISVSIKILIYFQNKGHTKAKPYIIQFPLILFEKAGSDLYRITSQWAGMRLIGAQTN